MLLRAMCLMLPLMAAEPTGQTRGILPEEFVNARPKPAQSTARKPVYKSVSPAMVSSLRKSSDYRQIGLTIWRLRPSAPADTGARILVHDEASTVEWTPERVPSGAPLKTGERLRVSIESPQAGYLYVIDREKYANGKLGDAYLIFPTTRVHNGDNQLAAGRLIELPAQDDRPNYFSLRQSRPDQVGEEITVLVSAKPLEGIAPASKATVVSTAQLNEWEKQWSGRVERFEMAGGGGKTWTKAEQEAGADQTRLLTQDDPGPQTIYRVIADPDKPILVKVGLQYGSAKTK